jgi:hypothetical protein
VAEITISVFFKKPLAVLQWDYLQLLRWLFATQSQSCRFRQIIFVDRLGVLHFNKILLLTSSIRSMSVGGNVLIACHYSSPSTLYPVFAVEFRQQSEGTKLIWM